METIGELLKTAREKKGLSIHDLEASTHIVAKYIDALEKEHFEDLPGEVYLKGFLKNISDKLGLNPNDMLELYKLQKSGELYQPLDAIIKDQVRPIKVKEKRTKDVERRMTPEQSLERERELLKVKEQSIKDNRDKNENKNVNDKNIDALSITTKKVDASLIQDIQNEAVSELLSPDKKITPPTLPTHEKLNNTNLESATADKQKIVQAKPPKEKVVKEKPHKELYSAEAALLMLSKDDLPNSKYKKGGGSPRLIIFVIIIIIAIIAVLVFINRARLGEMFTQIIPKKDSQQTGTTVQRNIVDSIAKQNVRAGDTIYFKPLGISATVRFVSIGNVIRIKVNEVDMALSKSSPIFVDLNENGVNDFRMTLIEVYEDLATVEFEKVEENSMINANVNSNTLQVDGSDVVVLETQNNILDGALQIIGDETYVEQNVEKALIFIEIVARHYVYIRYFIDSDRPATTNLASGRMLSLEANNVIMLTIGNAGDVNIKVNGKVIKIGEAGETVNKTIKWVRNLDDSTKFNLVISDTK